MSSSKKAKSHAPFMPTFEGISVGGFGTQVVTDRHGYLWRVDPDTGTMRRVTLEKAQKPNGRRRRAK